MEFVKDTVRLRAMQSADLPEVTQIERNAYPFPWSMGNFRDCLAAGYSSWVLVVQEKIIGYVLLSMGAGEGHILNICVAPEYQSQGYGRFLLRTIINVAIKHQCEQLFLEVRPSNIAAVKLYEKEGFNEIGCRPNYYPCKQGREDALVMAIQLFSF